MRKYTRAPASRATGGLSAAYLEAADEEGEEEEEYEEEAGVSASECARRDLSRPRHDAAAEVRLGSCKVHTKGPIRQLLMSPLVAAPAAGYLVRPRHAAEVRCSAMLFRQLAYGIAPCCRARSRLSGPPLQLRNRRAGRLSQTVLAYFPLDVSSGAPPAACCPASAQPVRVRQLT